MENINMTHVFKHPKYYTELRKRNKSDQAISDEASTEATSVRPGPGLKLQAASFKRQAFEPTSSFKRQATSIPTRVTSVKLQAASSKLPDS